MATLEQRLAKLEAAMAGRRRDDPESDAMGRMIAALRDALPAGDLAGAERLASYQSHMDKVLALAERIEAGELSEEDRVLLDGLPHDPALDMAPAEFIIMLAEVDSMC